MIPPTLVGIDVSHYGQIDEALRTVHSDRDPDRAGLMCSKVLLVHSGGDSQRSPTQCVCGKAWSALNSCPSQMSDIFNASVEDGGGDEACTRCNTPMDLLLDHLSRLFGSGVEPGTLVVTACDVMLLIPPDVAATADWSAWSSPSKIGSIEGMAEGYAVGLAIAADAAKYAANHGVYCLGGAGDEEQDKCPIRTVRRCVTWCVACSYFLRSAYNTTPRIHRNLKDINELHRCLTEFLTSVAKTN